VQSQQQPPSNLPFGQPQSPFQPAPPLAVPQPPVSAAAASGKIDDIFASTDSAPAPNAAYPSATPSPFRSVQPPVSGQPQYGQPSQPVYQPANAMINNADLFGGRSFPWGRVITVIIIILILAGLAVAAY